MYLEEFGVFEVHDNNNLFYAVIYHTTISHKHLFKDASPLPCEHCSPLFVNLHSYIISFSISKNFGLTNLLFLIET